MPWQIDPTHTSVEFAVRHLMVTTVKGTFRKVSGTIDFDEADFARSSVEVAIDAASIDTGEPKRDGHLRSPDFLDVENFPVITFRSRRIEPKGNGHHRIVGDLTIRGVTREVVLEAAYAGQQKDPWGNLRAGFSATTVINRDEYGAAWNVPLEAGGVVVGEQVRISLDVEAIKQA